MFPFAALLLATFQQPVANEADYYTVDYLQPPPGALVEVGGMDFLPDGRLALSTRRGQVWIVDNPLAADPKDAHFQLFAEGLQEGLGLNVVDGEIYVVQRSELSRLRDTDHDGVCDTIETVCNSWGVSGNYHEFAYGLPNDAEGNFYVSLNLGFTDPKWWHGRSLAPYRGWIVQISKSGKLSPYAYGFRSPCGLGMDDTGHLLLTDNQGDWEPVCPLYYVKPDAFHGAPASLEWTPQYQETKAVPSLTNPPDMPRVAPALWMPYGWTRSTGDMCTIPRDGKFGPFGGQLALAEMTNGLVLRADLEDVRGQMQGACMLLRQRIGSAIRVHFASDGTLFTGLTNRGWGGLGPSAGVARVRWNGKTPFEIEHVHLVQDGFELALSEPLAPSWKPDPADVIATQYHYDWWWEYGSPERGTRMLTGTTLETSADRKQLVVHFSDLAAGEVAKVKLSGLVSASGQALLHDEFAYTVNQLPEGPLCDTPVARVVPPPPARENGSEGWLRVCYGNAFEMWKPSHWKLADFELDPADPTKFELKDGSGALANQGVTPAEDYVSNFVFGDAKIHVECALPKGGATAVSVFGLYDIRLADPGDEQKLSLSSMGAVLPGEHFAGSPPLLPAFKGPGTWHDLDFFFRAPRFDASGKKTANARFERVMVDDVLLQNQIELTEPVKGARGPEVAQGPLVIRGGLGTCAVGGIMVRPLDVEWIAQGWTPLLAPDEIEGWKEVGGGTWHNEDKLLTSGGKAGFLETERDDYENFELRARCKINDGGLSGVWLRADAPETGAPAGYCVKLNASHPDAEKTGSILGFAPRTVHLVPQDTWFDLVVRCETTPEGNRISVRINGSEVNSALDTAKKFTKGRVMLEQHHEGSVLEVKDLAIHAL
ncbi:MAG: DUF1080 domain-containing protein [Planctomycetes bacterium]|nr:DUF1080 domain-containing protein [Planctomycetota bacterium]